MLISIAPDDRKFREWIGSAVPEWGAAVAVPARRLIVMQGSHAGSGAGDPRQVLRHELAHLALHEALGDLPPRWFDEGYASFAAGEWGREEVLATSIALVIRGVPGLDSLDASFHGGRSAAGSAYALAYRAVAEMSALDPARGLTLFFGYWRETRSMDIALRRAFGITQAAFERRYKEHTLRRYGALAVLGNVTLAAGIIALLLLPAHAVRRRRDRTRLKALLAADEASEHAARSDAIEELLRSASPPSASSTD